MSSNNKQGIFRLFFFKILLNIVSSRLIVQAHIADDKVFLEGVDNLSQSSTKTYIKLAFCELMNSKTTALQ